MVNLAAFKDPVEASTDQTPSPGFGEPISSWIKATYAKSTTVGTQSPVSSDILIILTSSISPARTTP